MGLAWRCPQSGGWAESSGLGIEGWGCRVALAGMLLAVQLVPHPEVPSHLQVQPAVSTGVAARMAVPPLLDTDGLVRDAGVALLTRVELGWAGQSPGGGQGGLRTQRAGQVGRCSTSLLSF